MTSDDPIQYGQVKASYFWDDGSGRNGDTGLPASGEPMQKGLFASPSWPLGTEGYIEYDGQRADFFIGDRGPGALAENCDILLDIDGKTFAELTGETFDQESLVASGGNGHIEVEYYITEWGDGDGNEGAPHPMGEEANRCEDAVSELPGQEAAAGGDQQGEREQAAAGNGEGQGPRAETVVSERPGSGLASGETPLAAGVLTLAILPAILAVLLLAGYRLLVTAGQGRGRHRKPAAFPFGGTLSLRPRPIRS